MDHAEASDLSNSIGLDAQPEQVTIARNIMMIGYLLKLSLYPVAIGLGKTSVVFFSDVLKGKCTLSQRQVQRVATWLRVSTTDLEQAFVKNERGTFPEHRRSRQLRRAYFTELLQRQGRLSGESAPIGDEEAALLCRLHRAGITVSPAPSVTPVKMSAKTLPASASPRMRRRVSARNMKKELVEV